MLNKASFIHYHTNVFECHPGFYFSLRFTFGSFWPQFNIALFKAYHQVLGFFCVKCAPHFKVLGLVQTAHFSSPILVQILLTRLLGREKVRFFWDSPINAVEIFLLANFGLDFLESKFGAWGPMLVVEFDLAYFRICDVCNFWSIPPKTCCDYELISMAKCFVWSKLLLEISLLHDVICALSQFSELVTAITQQN